MTQEEKAKRYDEAIEVAQRFYNNSAAITKKGLEDIFPELKESEDERIRKEISTYLKSVVANKGYGDSIIESWIAWLEKQGEKKLAAKVEPKFKIGDKVHLINGSSPNYEDDCIVISDISNNTYYGNWEGGYFAIKDQDKYELVEQKPAWSEEDIVAIDCAVEVLSKDLPSLAASIERLKSLRPQNTWKPSDEQLNALCWVLDKIKNYPIGGYSISVTHDLLKQLKAL